MNAPIVHRRISSTRSAFPRVSRTLGPASRREKRERSNKDDPSIEDAEPTIIVIGGHPMDLGPVATEMRRHPIRISTDRPRGEPGHAHRRA